MTRRASEDSTLGRVNNEHGDLEGVSPNYDAFADLHESKGGWLAVPFQYLKTRGLPELAMACMVIIAYLVISKSNELNSQTVTAVGIICAALVALVAVVPRLTNSTISDATDSKEPPNLATQPRNEQRRSRAARASPQRNRRRQPR